MLVPLLNIFGRIHPISCPSLSMWFCAHSRQRHPQMPVDFCRGHLLKSSLDID